MQERHETSNQPSRHRSGGHVSVKVSSSTDPSEGHGKCSDHRQGPRPDSFIAAKTRHDGVGYQSVGHLGGMAGVEGAVAGGLRIKS